MVNNIFLKCKLCNTKFRIRWQIGYNKADFNIKCPKCKVTFRGFLDSNNFQNFNKTLINCEQIEDCEPDYVCEVSTEFYCKKIYKQTSANKFDITPFIRFSSDIIKNLETVQSYYSFADNVDIYKNEITTINDLFDNKSYKYLKSKLNNENNPFINICKKAISNYKMINDLDYLMAIHQYSHTILIKCEINDTEKNMNYILYKVSCIAKTNYENIKNFCKEINKADIFKKLNIKFNKIIDNYFDEYRNLIPIYTNQDISSVNLNEFGITTLDLDNLIKIYKDSYEFVGEFLILAIGLNNIDIRNDYNNFYNGTSNLFNKFNSTSSKYNRIEQLLHDGETFSSFFKGKFNNLIRNSEAHFDYSLDPITQMITFTNNHNGIITTKQMYLIEFGKSVIEIFQTTLLIWEINYQLYKIYYMFNRNMKPHYGNSRF